MESMKFAQKLQSMVSGWKMSQVELAEKIGMSQGGVSKYLTSGSIPSADVGLKIARLFQVDIDWLFDDAQDMPAKLPGESLSNELLVQLIMRRHQAAHAKMEAILTEAETFPWKDYAAKLQKDGKSWFYLKPHNGGQVREPNDTELGLALARALVVVPNLPTGFLASIILPPNSESTIEKRITKIIEALSSTSGGRNAHSIIMQSVYFCGQDFIEDPAECLAKLKAAQTAALHGS